MKFLSKLLEFFEILKAEINPSILNCVNSYLHHKKENEDKDWVMLE